MLFARVVRFLALPFARKLALCEAVLLLVAAQAMVKIVPYRRWAPLLGPIRGEAEPDTAREDREEPQLVAWAVAQAARLLPWDAVCLPRAMAAKWMLARRNVASTLCVGIRRTAATEGGAELHAWLSVAGRALVGGEIADQFTVIARYGPAGGLPRTERGIGRSASG
ncbi:MAG: lasso peptide biosynthesis B2 protein [Variibacter sp.]|mgnify:CR=1 FL=1|nr:lasso peptide biosynthesis B2 protein [Variibacter sp.]